MSGLIETQERRSVTSGLDIEKVEAFHLRATLPEKDIFKSSHMVFDAREVVVVKITTRDGTVGYGESLGQPVATTHYIEKILAPLVIGKDPMDIRALWTRMLRGTWFRHQTALHVEALSAIDIALWDLKGKLLGLPVYKLLGGAHREQIPVYATRMYIGEPETVAREAAKLVSEGFDRIKMKIGHPDGLGKDIECVKAVREAIGPDVTLVADANGKYDLKSAIRASEAMAEYDLFWIEEPLRPMGPTHDIESYKKLRAEAKTRVAWGECEFLLSECKEFIVEQAVDIIQPDVCRAGGITESLRILDAAELHGIGGAIHFWTTGIGLAASLHLAAVVGDHFVFCEYDQSANPLREKLCSTKFELKDGMLEAPQTPGIGIEVDEDALKSYCV